ncbi:putative homing endonuclease [Campylobacter phage F352]|uniref:Putative homing endonuclease n=3 Tax=Fletchervirus CPX TaxID=1110702 RepID=A0A7T3N4R5_9CAUD|nr:putative homing endonuclease [Campylobacter phage F352]QPX65581.1 putative homing endonuclease [Campylobacter phage F374]QPX65748.1 putative homing endonuclease [Campylobacter phage F375]
MTVNDKIEFLNDLGYETISDSLGHDLEVKCKNGHIFKRSFSRFKSGSTACPECERQENVKHLNKLGYEVISENLSNNLEVKCKNGHVFKRTLNNFKKGQLTCNECEKQRKLLFINSLGYKVVSKELNNDLTVECQNGHIFKRPYKVFESGIIICTTCEKQEKLEYLNNLGYEVISDNLGNNLEVKCKNGHVFKRAFGDFKKGYTNCPGCIIGEKTKFLEDLGYKIISYTLGDNLEVECKNGHVFKRTYSNFKKGMTDCPECTKEHKIKFMANLEYEIISDNLGHDLEVKCKNGHIFKRPFGNFKMGNIDCPECIAHTKTKFLKNLGYEVVSENLSDYLEVKCSKGHIFKRTFKTFEKGAADCPVCMEHEKTKVLNSLGYKTISCSNVQCKNGHIFKRAFSLFRQGVITCPECTKEHKTKFLSSLEYKIISENLADNLEVECKNGHIFKRAFDNFKRGVTLCPICYPSTSSFEKEMSKILSNYINNDYSILGDKELDFYLPEHNLAIECNGDYWHSESNGKDKNYHLDKTERCNEKGIQLLHIFEHSWIEKKNIWTSIINNKLGKSKKIMARKCVIKEVPKTEEKEFLNENHLQGFTGSTVCYGLYYKDKLVCLMSFGKPRFTDKYDWELIRLCTKIGLNIIGGASKLLKHFHKHNPGSLISYSDRLYSDGSVYKQLGFEFSHFSKPGYFYFKNGIKYSRQQFMKHMLKDKLEEFNPNLTESENMKVNGYHKVWDCGQGVWIKLS